MLSTFENTRSALNSFFRLPVAFLLAGLFTFNTSTAQMTVTGTISGNVLDPSGKTVPGAKVTLSNAKTGDIRIATTNESGAFNFIAVPPETYTLKVESSGFKQAQRTGLVVIANERLAIGDIPLEVGAVSETISVEAQTAQVQTDSAE